MIAIEFILKAMTMEKKASISLSYKDCLYAEIQKGG